MARPLSYDRETVLDQARDLFWRKGFGKTSVRDLVEGTGLNPGSLYDGFGDKRALFLAALESYCGDIVAEMLAVLTHVRPGGAAIRAFFDALADSASDERWCFGCLLVNTAVDSNQIDADIADAVSDHLALIESALRESAARGQRDGSVAGDVPAEEIAAFLMTVLTGIRAGARAGTTDDRRTRQIIDLALARIVIPCPGGGQAPLR